MITTQKHHVLTFLNVVMMCETLIEGLEAIKGTDMYRHQLKLRVNSLMPELEKIIEKDLAKVWGVDGHAMYHLMVQQKLLIQRLATTTPETWNMINELLDMHAEDPEGFLKRNDIVVAETLQP